MDIVMSKIGATPVEYPYKRNAAEPDSQYHVQILSQNFQAKLLKMRNIAELMQL
jgi:hypothetical protein